MIIRIESFMGEDSMQLKQAFDIRKKVLVDEFGIDKFAEFDGQDSECVHYLLYYNDLPVATARWLETSEGIKIERFAVLSEFRKKAIGSLLLRFLVDELLPAKKTIYMNAQYNAVKFFQSNGFKIVGDKFTVWQIDHFRMEYHNLKMS